ncbi:GntR family transcriptional regulator [Marinithermofilum abyssi]|uniref:GntR family transcriptional regulator n=1 Tax=Marinithermofilum abyssi TaxID=1571185 RepID=A0A8J2VBZ5_9BACL|nr:FadR/GntR family transcriptional regulator [Marinithermofilum abyssi]GGE17390.1 GntR family transcriptional regulator [Marinithermofilum abyssi]
MFPEAGSNKFQTILRGIHQIIESDGLQPGDRLPSERELVSRLQAGRSSVREALRALELLGIIKTRRGEGTFLQPRNTHHLVDLLAFYILRDPPSRRNLWEIRVLLEVAAAGKAAVLSDKKEIKELEHQLNQMESLVKKGETLNAADTEFHRRVVEASKNDLMLRIWHPVHQLIHAVQTEPMDREKALQVLEEHRGIYTAIRSGRREQAESRMRSHLLKESPLNTD